MYRAYATKDRESTFIAVVVDYGRKSPAKSVNVFDLGTECKRYNLSRASLTAEGLKG
jgi:hypothetical protein